MRRLKLAEARKAAGKSQEKVGEDVGVDRTTIGKWERGESTPYPDQRAAYATSIGVSLSELHAILSSLPMTDEVPHWAHVYFAMEQSATEIWSHCVNVVYGLFQTTEYAEAIAHTVGTVDPGPEYAERTIRMRKARQTRIQSRELTVAVVQPEAALHLKMGSSAVMAAQMAQLAALCELPNITMQIAPYSAGQYEALRIGTFAMMLHPWRPSPSVHIEGYGGARLIDESDETAYFASVFEHAQKLALSPEESQDFIAQVSREWERAK